MYSSTRFAPSPESTYPETSSPDPSSPDLDSFAAFLEKLSRADVLDAPTRSVTVFESVPEEEAAALSYEHVLRRPHAATPSQSPFPAQPIALATTAPPETALVTTTERRNARASICLSERERDLLRRRAKENSLSVSAYVRSCIFEVEALREQVQQFMAHMQNQAQTTTAPPKPAIAAPVPTPVLSAPTRQSALPATPAPRQLKPAEMRPPQSAPRYTNSRVQAAIEEQKRLAAQQATQPRSRKPESKPSPRSGLFGFFFGARKNT